MGSASGRSAAELLTHAGACISQVGRTLHGTAGHADVFAASAEAPALVAAAVPAATLHRAWLLSLPQRRNRRRTAAAEFLVPAIYAPAHGSLNEMSGQPATFVVSK